MTAEEFLDTIHAIGADCNIDRPSIGENSAFVQSLTFNPKNMLIALCIGLVVLFAGVIVIYSIFYISIINRIKFFGQLRTIGTTGKQIKRIVKREGTLLFCIGAPLGLACWLHFCRDSQCRGMVMEEPSHLGRPDYFCGVHRRFIFHQ